MSAARSQNRAKNVNVVGKYSEHEWQLLKAKYDFRCVCCGKQEPEVALTADHVIPISSEDSSNYISNIQPLCRVCNASKANKEIDYRKDDEMFSFKTYEHKGLIVRIFDKK